MLTEKRLISISHSLNELNPVGFLPFAHSSATGVKRKFGMGIMEVNF